MGLGDPAHDAEADAAHAAARRGAAAEEPFEHPAAVLGGNPGTVVGHHHGHRSCVLSRLDFDPYGLAVRAVFEGVVQQVEHGEAQQGRVAVHLEPRTGLGFDPNPPLGGIGGEEAGRGAHQLPQVERRAGGENLLPRPAAVTAGEQEDPLDHGVQAADLLQVLAQQGLILGGGALAAQGDLDPRAQHAQGVADLVRGVGREAAHAVHVLFQPPQEGIERGGEHGHLLDPALGQPPPAF